MALKVAYPVHRFRKRKLLNADTGSCGATILLWLKKARIPSSSIARSLSGTSSKTSLKVKYASFLSRRLRQQRLRNSMMLVRPQQSVAIRHISARHRKTGVCTTKAVLEFPCDSPNQHTLLKIAFPLWGCNLFSYIYNRFFPLFSMMQWKSESRAIRQECKSVWLHVHCCNVLSD